MSDSIESGDCPILLQICGVGLLIVLGIFGIYVLFLICLEFIPLLLILYFSVNTHNSQNKLNKLYDNYESLYNTYNNDLMPNQNFINDYIKNKTYIVNNETLFKNFTNEKIYFKYVDKYIVYEDYHISSNFKHIDINNGIPPYILIDFNISDIMQYSKNITNPTEFSATYKKNMDGRIL